MPDASRTLSPPMKLAISGLFLPLYGTADSTRKAVEKSTDAILPRSVLTDQIDKLQKENQELRIRTESVEEYGLLRFQFTDGLSILCHVFRSDTFTGIPSETDEAIPHWTPVNAIPYDEMWEDDRHWFPLLAAHRHFVGNFEFDGDLMLSCEMNVAEGDSQNSR